MAVIVMSDFAVNEALPAGLREGARRIAAALGPATRVSEVARALLALQVELEGEEAVTRLHLFS